MWFKCGCDLLNCAVMREIERPAQAKDSSGERREYKFIELLAETAEDRADDIQDADDLARLVDTTPKQAAIIWEVCMRFNVLRKGPKGYSAKDWMIEQGILCDTKKWQNGGGTGGGYTQTSESKNSFL